MEQLSGQYRVSLLGRTRWFEVSRLGENAGSMRQVEVVVWGGPRPDRFRKNYKYPEGTPGWADAAREIAGKVYGIRKGSPNCTGSMIYDIRVILETIAGH